MLPLLYSSLDFHKLTQCNAYLLLRNVHQTFLQLSQFSVEYFKAFILVLCTGSFNQHNLYTRCEYL